MAKNTRNCARMGLSWGSARCMTLTTIRWSYFPKKPLNNGLRGHFRASVFSTLLTTPDIGVPKNWLPQPSIPSSRTDQRIKQTNVRASFNLPACTIDADLPKNTQPDKTQLLDNRVRLTTWYINFVPNSGVCVTFQPTPSGVG